MIRRNLKKEYTNNLLKGFTLMELLIGSLIASVACLAIIYSSTYYNTRLYNLKLRERAHEELKGYTDFWKSKIAANDISQSSNSNSKLVCLLEEDNICVNQATLNSSVTDVTTAPIQGVNDNEDSRVLRKALTTSIRWETRLNVDQKIEFYVEQLVLQQ